MNLNDLAKQQNQMALRGPLYQGFLGQNCSQYNALLGTGASSNWIHKRPAIEVDFGLYIDGCKEAIEEAAQRMT